MNTGSRQEQRLERVPAYAGLAVAAAGGAVLIGWIAHIPILTSLLPGLVTMKPNTAAAFVIFAACLWLLGMRSGDMPPAIRLRAAQVLAVLLATSGLLTMLQYAAHVDLGIDRVLLGTVIPHPQDTTSWRMAPMTAVNITLLAIALLSLDVVTARGRRPAHWIALVVTANSFLAVLGYVYGVSALYRIGALTSVALHTALLMIVVCFGLVFLRPRATLVRMITGDSVAGVLMRRMLPAAVLLPPVLGWLRWQGELLGYYDTAYGLALFAASNVAVFVVLAWWSARTVQHFHEQKIDLARTSDWQEAILNSADLIVISTDVSGTIQTINVGAASQLGYAPEELVGRSPEVIHEVDEVVWRAEVLSRELGRLIEPGFETFVAKTTVAASDENDWTYVRKDGSRFPVRLSVTPLLDRHGALKGYVGIGRNISAQREAEDALRDSEQRVRLITDNVPALIAYIDRNYRFQYNNSTYATWLERPLEAITGLCLDEVYDAETFAIIRPQVDRALQGEVVAFAFKLPTSNRFIEGTYVPDFGVSGQPRGVYGFSTDVTAQKKAEDKLRRLAEVDSLTGLANRNRLVDSLAETIARSEHSGRTMALMFLDLDDFKSINDTLGHQGGDVVLQEFARRLSHSVRPTDTVARLAGDEFVVLLEDLNHPHAADAVATKIISAMAKPFQVCGETRTVSASMGIAVRRSGETRGDALMQRADGALYQAKSEGKAQFVVVE